MGHSPLIQEDGEEKKLKLRFDVSQYTPEEIVVKTVDQKLMVHAKHEEKTDTKSVYREYNREFLLPKGTNPNDPLFFIQGWCFDDRGAPTGPGIRRKDDSNCPLNRF